MPHSLESSINHISSVSSLKETFNSFLELFLHNFIIFFMKNPSQLLPLKVLFFLHSLALSKSSLSSGNILEGNQIRPCPGQLTFIGGLNTMLLMRRRKKLRPMFTSNKNPGWDNKKNAIIYWIMSRAIILLDACVH